MSITKNIPVTSEIQNIKSVEFKGFKIFVAFEDGETAVYKYEFIGRN